MSAKLDRSLHGPSLTEVVLGALLSVILGGVIGAALLVARPVLTGKDLPKKESDRDPKAVYYQAGARDPSKSRVALAKRKSFGEGQSVSFTEDELNALAALPAAALANPGAENPPPAPKAEKSDAAGALLDRGPMNFRVRDGRLQMAVPVTLNVLGIAPTVMVQAQGTFVKESNGYVFVPDTFHLGSLPLQRLPMAAGYVREQLLMTQAIPDDVKASWAKLASVSIEGNTLKLTMP